MQLFPLDMTVADRWFYFPMTGLLGVLGLVLTTIELKISHYILLFVIYCLLFERSILRIKNWQDGITLYSHDLISQPRSFDLLNNLGVELHREHKDEEAKQFFEKSIEVAPEWWTNWNNLGALAEDRGDYSNAKQYYLNAIANGNYYLSYPNYATVLIKEKEFTKAKEFISKSLRLYPNSEVLLDLYSYASILEQQAK